MADFKEYPKLVTVKDRAVLVRNAKEEKAFLSGKAIITGVNSAEGTSYFFSGFAEESEKAGI